jgi:hypothetical protein
VGCRSSAIGFGVSWFLSVKFEMKIGFWGTRSSPARLYLDSLFQLVNVPTFIPLLAFMCPISVRRV